MQFIHRCLMLLSVAVTASASCPTFTNLDAVKATAGLQKRYQTSEGILKIVESRPLEKTCIHELLVRAESPNGPSVFKIYMDVEREFIFRDYSPLDGESSIAADGELLDCKGSFCFGNKDAKVQIVTFIDFDCPYCKDQIRLLLEYAAAHPQTVRVMFRHLPLPSHPLAFRTATTAVCLAREDSNRARRILYRLTSVQNLGPKIENRFFGLDDTSSKQIEACTKDAEGEELVVRDMKLAARLEISRTPTMFANGKRILDAVRSFEDLDKATASDGTPERGLEVKP